MMLCPSSAGDQRLTLVLTQLGCIGERAVAVAIMLRFVAARQLPVVLAWSGMMLFFVPA